MEDKEWLEFLDKQAQEAEVRFKKSRLLSELTKENIRKSKEAGAPKRVNPYINGRRFKVVHKANKPDPRKKNI